MAPESPTNRAKLLRLKRDIEATQRREYHDPDMEPLGVEADNARRAIRMKLDRINDSIKSLQFTMALGFFCTMIILLGIMVRQ
jgi:hypothetical protein